MTQIKELSLAVNAPKKWQTIKQLLTHIELPNKAGYISMFEKHRKNILCEACLVNNMKTGSTL
jgi:hypothetical protein